MSAREGGRQVVHVLGNCRVRRCVPITSQLVRRAWGSATFSFDLSSSTPIPSTVATRWAGSAHDLRESPAIHCGDALERTGETGRAPCLPPPANVPYVHAPGGGPPRRGLGLGGLARSLGCCIKLPVCFARRLVTEREHNSRPGNDITNTASPLHVPKPERQGEMSAEGQIWEPHR